MEKTTRHYALDWLRVGGTISVLLFHSARFFNADDWHVKNATLDPGLDIFAEILIQWLMPLFFILSGAATWMALKRQPAGKLALSKIPRLLVPLVFGILVLSPPQVYLERLTHAQFSGGFLAWLPQYFHGFYAFGGNFAWMGMHLWYLLVLLIWTLVTLPLCVALQRGAAQKIAAFLTRPGALLLLILPVAALEYLLTPTFLDNRSMGGWSPIVYVLFYLYGFILPADERLPRAFARQAWAWLAVAIVVPVVALATGLTDLDAPFGSLVSIGLEGLRTLNAIAWLAALVGLGYRYLTFRNRFLDLATEAVLPFYMLHQMVLLIIGYFVVQWPWPALAKYGFIAATGTVVILATYIFLIRPFGPMRYLFGLKVGDRHDGSRAVRAS